MATTNMELIKAEKGTVVVIRSWTAILTLGLWVLISVAQFVSVRNQTDENTKDIERLREETVNQKQFDEMREDVIHRLDRIEAKIDEQKALQKLN